MAKVTARHTSYIIKNYELGDCPTLEEELSVFNKTCYRMDPLGFYYNPSKQELRIPRGFDVKRMKYFFETLSIDIDHDDYDIVKDTKLKFPPNTNRQKKMLTYMCGREQYSYTTGYSQLMIDLDTGEGKTYCAIATMCYWRCKMVVVIPSGIGKLKKQWKDSALEFTNLTAGEIMVVDSSKKCKEIVAGVHENVKIFIISHKTIDAFVKSCSKADVVVEEGDDETWFMNEVESTPSNPYPYKCVTKLFKAMKVGMKVVDEAHLNFSGLVKLDCHTNIKRNYYLTATPMRNDKQQRKIYKKLFNNMPILGRELKDAKDNHIIVMVATYSHKPSVDDIKDCKNRWGLNANKYGEYTLGSARKKFLDVFSYTLDLLMHKNRKRDGKLLILCPSIWFMENLKEYLDEAYPEFTSGLYNSKIPNKVREAALKDNDIVLATEKGFGTGTEFKNHQFTINTIAYSAEGLSKQGAGRLRRNDNEGRDAIYVEIVNRNFKSAYDQFKNRKLALSTKAKNGTVIIYNH
jgi:hypothetical protein